MSLTDTTPAGESRCRNYCNEGNSIFPKARGLESRHQMLFSVIPGHSLRGVLPFCRDAVSVFYSHSRLGHQDTRWAGGGLAPLQRCSRPILQPQPTWPPGHSLGGGGGLAPLQRCSRPILQPQPTWPPGYSFWGVLYLCRDAVDPFYSNNRLGWIRL